MTSADIGSEASAQSKSIARVAKPIEFSGTGSEFFGIWIVNAILTALTLGIYSAWATVRVRKYFAGNTYVEGIPLQYHAKGIQLLLGRLLALGALALASILIYVASFTGQELWLVGGLVIATIVALPWVLNRAFRFNNRMTSWRNVRFDWTASYGSTFVILYLWPLVSIIPFMAPFLWRAQQEFLGNSSAFGAKPFSLNTGVGPYFMTLFILIAIGLAFLLFAALMIFGLTPGIYDQPNFVENEQFLVAIMRGFFSTYAVGIVIAVLSYSMYYTRLRNVSVNNLALTDVAKFESDLHPVRLFWILLSNGFLMVVTIGLFTPWALVRYERYIRTSVKTVVVGDLDALIDHENKAGDAFGAELVGLEGIDVGI